MDESQTNRKIPFRKSDRYLIVFLILALLLVNAILNLLFGQAYTKYATFNINNISTYVWNNGRMDISPNGNGGFFYPKENKVKLFNSSGLILGGYVGKDIRVQGSHFKSSFLPGKVLEDGTTENPFDERNRVFKVRPDYKTADLKNEIENSINVIINNADEKDTLFFPLQNEDDIFLNYEKDWLEWPAEKGAPFDDVDGDGFYNPQIDIPGVIGADQSLWFVMNDFNIDTAKAFEGSPPLKLEIQVTVWGYNNYNYLDDYLFKEYKIINKSDVEIKKMYSAIWCNPDIGYNLDDFVGCDTTLNLGFAYNGSLIDPIFNCVTPAAGYLLLENTKSKGSNSVISSFAFNGEYICFPGFRKYCYYLENFDDAALLTYNLFLGRIATSGQPFIDPITGLPTKFTFAGDPVDKIGWYDGQLHSPGDRAFLMTTGSYDLPPNDTVRLSFAQFAAFGRDRLNSVSFLKKQARFIKSVYPKFEELKKEISPPQPKINSAYLHFSNNIKLTWDNETESYSEKGYDFQGYNIYQFFSKQNLFDNAIKIETLDKIDNIREIYGVAKSQASGNPYFGILQSGKNKGIKNSILINYDFTKNIPIAEGQNYWFGVSSYYYNSENEKTVESEIEQIVSTPDFNNGNYTELNRYKLLQNYPNPFNPTTKIKFSIPYVADTHLGQDLNNTSSGYALIKVYDVLGREVKVLLSEDIYVGEHEIEFNGNGLPSGIYLYSLSVNNKIIDRKKMVLLK